MKKILCLGGGHSGAIFEFTLPLLSCFPLPVIPKFTSWSPVSSNVPQLDSFQTESYILTEVLIKGKRKFVYVYNLTRGELENKLRECDKLILSLD